MAFLMICPNALMIKKSKICLPSIKSIITNNKNEL